MKSLSKFFNPSPSASSSDAGRVLSLEVLEERQMLSTVSIFAQGTTGEERFEASTNGIFLGSGTVSTEVTEFQFDYRDDILLDDLDVNDIKIEFLNDFYDPANGVDRNLTIDKIRVGDRFYETESSAVFSTGTWTAADGVQDGFGRGETLHSGGFFQYSENAFSGFADVTHVTIDARGFGDSVDYELQLDGESVRTYALSARAGVPARSVDYTFNGSVSADRIRVAFFNDRQFIDPISGSLIDRNLQINSVTIDGEVYRGTDSDVFSTGTWTAADGVQDGFGRGDFLHTDGYFQFADRQTITTEITVDASALGLNVDSVRFSIEIDGATPSVYEFAISPLQTGIFDRVVTFTVDGPVDPSQVRIVFANDVFTPTLDRNLRINSLTIDGVSYDAADSSVLSTGTWREEDGVVTGFGRGNILHSNGFFQFA